MIRLFISLYLVVIGAILAINWSSEYLWLQFNEQEDPQIVMTKQLIAALAASDQLSAARTLEPSSLAVKSMATSDIAWLEQQLLALNQGKVVVVSNLNDQLMFYVKSASPNTMFQIGPLQRIEQNSTIKYLLFLISYLLLAVIIALWTRPIWRDLSHLSRVAEHINRNDFDVDQPLSTRSPIRPIVQSINHMAQRIRHLLAEQKHLINAVSHELRTPLSRLRFSLALIPQVDESQQQEFEQDINEIEHLIDELLSYSRIEHFSEQQEKSLVDVNQLLENQKEKHQRTTDITLNLTSSVSTPIYANGELLERACQNLITNAIKYAKSTVNITCNITNQQLMIIIEDDGDGIAEQDRARLFEPFSRVDSSRNKANGGYGLGLAIVSKACQWHNGQCVIEQAEIGGAKFTIKLPINA